MLIFILLLFVFVLILLVLLLILFLFILIFILVLVLVFIFVLVLVLLLLKHLHCRNEVVPGLIVIRIDAKRVFICLYTFFIFLLGKIAVSKIVVNFCQFLILFIFMCSCQYFKLFCSFVILLLLEQGVTQVELRCVRVFVLFKGFAVIYFSFHIGTVVEHLVALSDEFSLLLCL